MRRLLVSLGIGCLWLASAAAQESRLEINGKSPEDVQAEAVSQLLEQQAQAWNQGDLARFMDAYWKSESLTFSAGGETTRGWQETMDRYRTRYPDGRAMGKLRFSNLEVISLGEQSAYVLGRWELALPNGVSRGGNFTLILRHIEGQWRIVHDHTSVLESTP